MKTLLMKTTQVLFALALAAATGCDDPRGDLTEVDDNGEVSLRPGSYGGILFNTNWLGKYALSELDINFGVEHNGATMLSVTLLKYGKLDAVFVKNGLVYGKLDGQTLTDKAFLNSKWEMLVRMEGVKTPVMMTLTDIQVAGANKVYTFKHMYNGGPKVPVPNCDEDLDSPGLQFGAILTGDISVDAKKGLVKSRPNTIYIGCLSGGVGKAAKWGYPQHKVGNTNFEAAIRMVRADYCGTGDSFTVPGNPVEIRDLWGYNDFPAPAAPTEALWGKSGAQCIAEPRHQVEFPDAKSIQEACAELGAYVPKECVKSDDLSTFGSLFWTKNP